MANSITIKIRTHLSAIKPRVTFSMKSCRWAAQSRITRRPTCYNSPWCRRGRWQHRRRYRSRRTECLTITSRVKQIRRSRAQTRMRIRLITWRIIEILHKKSRTKTFRIRLRTHRQGPLSELRTTAQSGPCPVQMWSSEYSTKQRRLIRVRINLCFSPSPANLRETRSSRKIQTFVHFHTTEIIIKCIF